MEHKLEKIEREVSDRGYQSDSQAQELERCSLCHKRYRPWKDDSKTTEEGKDCDDCGRTVCSECSSSVNAPDSEVMFESCNTCELCVSTGTCRYY